MTKKQILELQTKNPDCLIVSAKDKKGLNKLKLISMKRRIKNKYIFFEKEFLQKIILLFCEQNPCPLNAYPHNHERITNKINK